MSLHDSASQVQSAGRGDDKVLVHMTPGEVNGLQSLAMAHGGSLTINPHTGLPEAGFLSSLLPTIIGFGLAPFTGGLSAALITGAGYTAATGSLKKGIMAGLGAYGGASLAGGLNAMGAQAAAPAMPAGAAGAPGLTPSVAANTSTLAGNAPLSGVGTAQPFTSTNQIFADVAKTQAAPFQLAPVNPSYLGQTTPFTPGPVNAGSLASQTGNRAFTAADLPPAISGKPYPYDVVAKTGTSISRPFTDYMSQVGQGAKNVYAGGVDGLGALADAMPKYSITAGLVGTAGTYGIEKQEEAEEEMRKRKDALDTGMIRPYTFDYGATNIASEPYSGSAERTYFQPTYTAGTPYKAPGPEYAAEGGLMGLAVGGPVEQMAAMNSVGANTGYPMASINTPVYSNPMMQRPEATNVVAPSADAGVGAYSGEMRFARGGGTAKPESSGYSYSYDPSTQRFTQVGGPNTVAPKGNVGFGNLISSALAQGLNQPQNVTPDGTVSGGIAAPVMQPAAPAQSFVPNINIPAYQTPEQQLGLGGFYEDMDRQLAGYKGYAAGGVSHLGDYSDGGRLLKGPGDGVSDSIPASIGNRQPARLADGEFVIPARIVSEIGNGSTEAGARKLYAMMDRVQRARRKTVGKDQVARNTKAEKLLPA